ncbi:lymphotoxin-alpha [Sander lucioperca]|uniref:lymphotoxin-alpha n=1 Tax=Sander lucioperca TaxID=283035 RepID=UPI0016538947|nr:lymphotoxin-alpha [Sander lucioperca]
MEGQSRSSTKYLLLQVWCGILTVAMVVMAALFISIKPKSTEEEVSTLKPETVSPTGLTVNTIAAPLKGKGSSFSYIQLKKSFDRHLWEESTPKCHSCSLVLLNDSIHCNDNGLYFIYAQVTFNKPKKSQTKSVILKRNATPGKREKTLVEGTFPNTTEGTVWVAKTVRLTEGDSVSLNITDDFQADSTSTFWGAYQLH